MLMLNPEQNFIVSYQLQNMEVDNGNADKSLISSECKRLLKEPDLQGKLFTLFCKGGNYAGLVEKFII